MTEEVEWNRELFLSQFMKKSICWIYTVMWYVIRWSTMQYDASKNWYFIHTRYRNINIQLFLIILQVNMYSYVVKVSTYVPCAVCIFFTPFFIARAWVVNLKKRVPITSKSSNFKGETQRYVVKLPKATGSGQYCPKILLVPGIRGTRTNSSPE